MTVAFDLSGKTVLITGAGSGIGARSARLAAAAGAAVVLAGNVAADLEREASAIRDAGGRARAVPTDVTREADIAAAVAAAVDGFGGLHGVVANAGVQRHRTDRDLHALDLDEWQCTEDVNLRGVVCTCKHALASFVEHGVPGSVVIMSSVTALNGRTPNVAYMTAKTGLLGLNRHVAVHYAAHGIRCNAICPGALERTPDWDQHPDPDGRRAAMQAAIPLARLGTPDDIAPWVVFLLSDAAGYATGGTFVVDGGMTVA